jgi:sec-independent protein translocase protein TatC
VSDDRKDVGPDKPESEEELEGAGNGREGPEASGLNDMPAASGDGSGEPPAENGSQAPGETGGPPEDDEDDPDDLDRELPLTAHLEELRKRLMRIFIAVAVGFAGSYAFSKRLFDILMQPMAEALETSHFIYTYPPEAFFTYIKVALVAGVFVTSPYIFFQIWQFVAPGLYKHERRWMIPIAFFSAAFFVAGALFGYFVVFPYGFEFFAGFATEQIVFTPKLSEYLGFSLKLLFAFGVTFELPLFIFFLARLGIVTHKGLRKKQKYAILLSFVASSILTPPDVITQSLMAGPLILLYEVSIWVARFFGKKRPRSKREETEDYEDDEDEG